MISVVYALGKGSRLKDFEIKMSLRSVEKNLSNVKDVWVVGECPIWLKVNHIPATDPFEIPDRNILSKIMKAVECPEVTDEFLFANDDHFLLKPFDAELFPYYYSMDMEAYLKSRGTDNYRRRVRNSYEFLKAKGLPTKYFDSHTPILYNKSKFKHIMSELDWSKSPGFVLKSVYANSLNIEGTQQEDYKGNLIPTQNVNIFSTLPTIKASIQRFLMEQFPTKSKYEL